MLLIEEGLLAPEEEPGIWEIVFRHRGWYGTGWPLLTRWLERNSCNERSTGGYLLSPKPQWSITQKMWSYLWFLGYFFFLKGPVFRIYHERYRCRSEWTWFRDTQLSQVARIAQISQQTSAMGAKTATTLGHQCTLTSERWLLGLKRLHQPFIKDLKMSQYLSNQPVSWTVTRFVLLIWIGKIPWFQEISGGSSQGSLPFGLGRPVPPVVMPVPKPDPQALISKRVEVRS